MVIPSVLLSTFLGLLFFTRLAPADVLETFEQSKKDSVRLYAFLKEMPKGGELHYHLSGGVYTEVLVGEALQEPQLCVQPPQYSLKADENCVGIKSADILQYPGLYQQIIKAWSLKDFIPTPNESAHDHFFSAFFKYHALVSRVNLPLFLADILERAAQQHELYLEIMSSFDYSRIDFLPQQPILPANYAQLRQDLFHSAQFIKALKDTEVTINNLLPQTYKLLKCDRYRHKEACNIKVTFQFNISRNQPLAQVFAEAVLGFALAHQLDSVVGVNLVQMEDGQVALKDYQQHMQIFAYLHRLYPKVHIALHAGELNLSLVEPKNLRFHISEAIAIGKAERIGHGADIAYEDDSEALVNTMAAQKIPVEVSLSSNKAILGVSGAAHPIRFYLEHQVPVVLSTDDEGILRTDLTQEYVLAVLEQDLSYPTLKQINRNTLSYGFLAGKSLWLNEQKAIPVEDCQDLNSAQCLQYCEKNEKANLQRLLELKIQAFEARFRMKNE